MAIQVQGNAGVVQETDSTHRATRVSHRPMELGARGAYALGMTSGTMAAGLASSSEIIQMRWADATRVMLLRSVILTATSISLSSVWTGGQVVFGLQAARSWTVDGGAGTAVVFTTANTNKKRTDFSLSAFSDTGVRFSATGALTAGTKTLDTNKMASITTSISSLATGLVPAFANPGTYLWQRNTADEYPILFEQNEGFVVTAQVPATGTWVYSVNVEWAEVDPTVVTGW